MMTASDWDQPPRGFAGRPLLRIPKSVSDQNAEKGRFACCMTLFCEHHCRWFSAATTDHWSIDALAACPLAVTHSDGLVQAFVSVEQGVLLLCHTGDPRQGGTPQTGAPLEVSPAVGDIQYQKGFKNVTWCTFGFSPSVPNLFIFAPRAHHLQSTYFRQAHGPWPPQPAASSAS